MIGTSYNNTSVLHNVKYVSVENYGAKGDGVSNDVSAFNTALAAAGENGVVELSGNKTYLLSNNIHLFSGQKLLGNGAKLIFTAGAMLVKGSGLGDESISIDEDCLDHQGSIKLGSSSDLSKIDVNKFYVIDSHTDALDPSAGDWQLGKATAHAADTTFAELIQISSIDSYNLTINLTSGLTFPKYSKASTTINSANFIENVHIENLTIETYYSLGIYFSWAKDCSVKNVQVQLHDQPCTVVRFDYCFSCIADSVKVTERPKYIYDPTNYYSYNAFKFVSSWFCKFFNCRDINGSQSFDTTYILWPSMYCMIDSCEAYASCVDGITTHSGAYGIQIINCRLDKCHRGISTRSRLSLISNNHILGYPEKGVNPVSGSIRNSTGVALIDGFCLNTTCSNNTIEGVYYGVRILRASSQGAGFTKLYLAISGNNISNCTYGICNEGDHAKYSPLSGSGYDFTIHLPSLSEDEVRAIPDSYIIVSGNIIRDIGLRGIYFESAMHGVQIINNVIDANYKSAPDYDHNLIQIDTYTLRTSIHNNRFGKLTGHAQTIDVNCLSAEATISDFQGTSIVGNTAELNRNAFQRYITPSGSRNIFGNNNFDRDWSYYSSYMVSLENDGQVVLQMAAPKVTNGSDNVCHIQFGNEETPTDGEIRYTSNTGRMSFRVSQIPCFDIRVIGGNVYFIPNVLSTAPDRKFYLGTSSWHLDNVYSTNITLGDTTLTETKLQQLLNLLK